VKKGNTTVKLPAGKMELAGSKPGVRKGHESRALAAINVFEKQSKESSSTFDRFLLHYYCCDVLAHLMQGCRNGLTPAKAIAHNASGIDISEVRAALQRLTGEWSISELDTIFHSKKPNDSARRLRNDIVHRLDEKKVQLVNSNIGKERMRSMRRFIDATKSFIVTGGTFARK